MYNAEDFRVKGPRDERFLVRDRNPVQARHHEQVQGVNPAIRGRFGRPTNNFQPQEQQRIVVEAGRRHQVAPTVNAMNGRRQMFNPMVSGAPEATRRQPSHLDKNKESQMVPQDLQAPHQPQIVPNVNYQDVTPNNPPPPPTCTFGAPDCAGVCGGSSVRDCAGVCYDPTKTQPTSVVDCAGVCGGKSELDCAGTCYDPTKGPPPKVRDCSGTCGGTKVPDCKGVCGGTSAPDCAGTCGGTATMDCKGQCGGKGTYDCGGNCYDPTKESPKKIRDCNGTCDGNGYYDCKGKCVTPNCTWDGKPVAHGGNYAEDYERREARSGRPRMTFTPKNV